MGLELSRLRGAELHRAGPRFASDGIVATAEGEVDKLVDGAHARGIRIVLDIVLDHASRVFDYPIAADGSPDLTANESSREALWGKPDAFDAGADTFSQVAAISGYAQKSPPSIWPALLS